jgi:hypothetical protein
MTSLNLKIYFFSDDTIKGEKVIIILRPFAINLEEGKLIRQCFELVKQF